MVVALHTPDIFVSYYERVLIYIGKSNLSMEALIENIYTATFKERKVGSSFY